MIDHCVSTLKKNNEKKLYDTYLVDAVRLIVNNTARQDQVTQLTKRYSELVDPKPAEERSGDEIIDGIRKKLQSGR